MMFLKRREYAWLVIATLAAALAGCTGGAAPDESDEARVQDWLGFLQREADIAESEDPSDACVIPGKPATPVQRRMFRQLNEYRQEHGLEQLVYSKQLEAAAQVHLQDMCERGYFAHITPEGLTPGNRAMDSGFCHEYVGENLAAGQLTAKAALRAWDNSPSHQVNMLEPNYVYVGVGHFVDPVTGRQYWAQEFAYQLQ